MLDSTDYKLLRIWQSDPDMPLGDLARACALTPARATRRIEKLRAAGVFRGRRAVIDWRALGYEVAVSLRVTLDKTRHRAFEEFTQSARAIPEVIEIQTFLGHVDLRLSVIARDMAHYQAIWRDQILALPHIADVEGLMTVVTVKDDRTLPV